MKSLMNLCNPEVMKGYANYEEMLMWLDKCIPTEESIWQRVRESTFPPIPVIEEFYWQEVFERLSTALKEIHGIDSAFDMNYHNSKFYVDGEDVYTLDELKECVIEAYKNQINLLTCSICEGSEHSLTLHGSFENGFHIECSICACSSPQTEDILEVHGLWNQFSKLYKMSGGMDIRVISQLYNEIVNS
jgi:hypothetical protein